MAWLWARFRFLPRLGAISSEAQGTSKEKSDCSLRSHKGRTENRMRLWPVPQAGRITGRRFSLRAKSSAIPQRQRSRASLRADCLSLYPAAHTSQKTKSAPSGRLANCVPTSPDSCGQRGHRCPSGQCVVFDFSVLIISPSKKSGVTISVRNRSQPKRERRAGRLVGVTGALRPQRDYSVSGL